MREASESLVKEIAVSDTDSFPLGTRRVRRMGYGAMRLSGPQAFGPPADWDGALALLRQAVAAGVDHLDTSDYYGPHVVNGLIKEALSPYPDGLVIATKVGAARGVDGSWEVATSPGELRRAVEENLKHLGLNRLAVVNFRAMIGGAGAGPVDGSIAAPIEALAKLHEEGLIEHLGVSNVTPSQVAEAQSITPIACVQNQYNIGRRDDDALIDALAAGGVAYVPFFPLGGLNSAQSARLETVAHSLDATPLQIALAWLLRRSPNILLIPGTSSIDHMRENLAASAFHLSDATMAVLGDIARQA